MSANGRAGTADFIGGAPPPSVTTSPLVEIGQTGLRAAGGFVYESRNPQFNGATWRETLTQMWTTDPVIGAVYRAIELLIRQIEWSVLPATPKGRAAKKNAQFFGECLIDMNQSWPTIVVNVLSMVIYGWSFFEIVYKYRQGPNPTRAGSRATSSKFNDGKLGWRKIALRSQDSLLRWEFDGAGGTQGMWQLTPTAFVPVYIPIRKALLFRLEQYKDNPEGISVLRNAWRPWFFRRNIEQIEAIGVERDLAGLPVLEMPLRMMQQDSSDSDKAVVEQMRELVSSVKRDATDGLIMPQDVDRNGHKLFEFKLLSSSGQRQFDTEAIIQRYNLLIATSMLADFLFLGHARTGSYALATTKTNLFTSALEAIADTIVSTMNDYAIPRLFNLNGIYSDYPTLQHGKIREVNLQVIAEFIQRLTASGASFFPSRTLENWLLTEAGMPIPPDDDRPAPNAVSAPPPATPGDAPRTARPPEPNRRQMPGQTGGPL